MRECLRYSLRSRRLVRTVPIAKRPRTRRRARARRRPGRGRLRAIPGSLQGADRLGREVVADVAGEQFGQRREDEEEGERGDDRADLVADDRADSEAEGAEQRKGDDHARVDWTMSAVGGQVPGPRRVQGQSEAAVDDATKARPANRPRTSAAPSLASIAG